MKKLDAYCLIPRKTMDGKTYIARAEWEDWFGELVYVNERLVSGCFSDRLDAVPWCLKYASENEGFLTSEQARDRLERFTPRKGRE